MGCCAAPKGRMEELMAQQPDKVCSGILFVFSNAHKLACQEINNFGHTHSYIALQERRIPILEKSQRFHEQGTAMCHISFVLINMDRFKEAATWSERARDIGAAGGFFLLECHACMGLATEAMKEGHHQDGLDLYQNAVVAAELNALDDPVKELYATTSFIFALFEKELIEEVEPLVLRYESWLRRRRNGVARSTSMIFTAYASLLAFTRFRARRVRHTALMHIILTHCCTSYTLLSACLHKVPCIYTPRCPAASPTHCTDAHYSNTLVYLLHSALCRHTRSLQMPRERCALCST